MGPWIHGQQGSFAHGQVSFGSEAAIKDPLKWRLDWYDHWLRGEKTVVGRDDPFRTPVRIFVMGTGDGRKTDKGLLNHGGYWRNENEWPPARAKATAWHLLPAGKLAPAAPPADGGSTSYDFDPRNPVPTIGGNISSGNDILLQGAWNQKGGPHLWNWPHPIPLSARKDVLVFQSDPLKEDGKSPGN